MTPRLITALALALALAILPSCVVATGKAGTLAMMGTNAKKLRMQNGEASFSMDGVNQSNGLGKVTDIGKEGLKAWTTGKIVDGATDLTGQLLGKGADVLKTNKAADTSIQKAQIDAGVQKAALDAAQ